MTVWGGECARGDAPPPRALVLAAFAAVYGIWGSTYLAIAVALETLPPLLMVSLRFLLAGTLLLLICLLRGEPWPGLGAWSLASRQAVFLFGAYGLLAWAELRVASGAASVLAATSPLFVLAMDAGARGRFSAGVGVSLGLCGVVVLAAPWRGAGGLDPAGTLALLGSALLWAAGSARPPTRSAPGSPLMATSVELLLGSGLLLAAGLAMGEAAELHPTLVSARSLLALGYLVVFGSVVAYTAFRWLLGVASPTLVATHAYVNPVIALALGWLLHGEALGGATFAAAGMVLGGVVSVAAVTR
jgi:drug/metabolite transporter (DMT)-like permease